MRTPRHTAIVGITGLIASILGFAVALVITIDQAALHFRRAALAQAQFASVLRIARLIETGDQSATADALSTYRRQIAAETQLVPHADHTRETDMAARLILLVDRGKPLAARAEIDRIVAATIVRERGEAVIEADAMAILRRRAWWLTASLMFSAVGSALLGGGGLLRANRRLTREVVRRTADIAAIDASRRLFFAKASHELRTPVTVMRGEAEVALALPGSEADALRHVIAQAEFLDHRIAELLALAQAEDGQIRLAFERCDLRDIAAAAEHEVAGYARSNAVRIVIESRDAVTVRADRRWLTQALVAVLDNAIRFSSAGGVVHIAVSGSTLSIADTGIGLLPEAVPRVFDAFYQASDDSARGGSGLGLALARWVVESHYGTIVAANGDGGGCVMTMTLPVAA